MMPNFRPVEVATDSDKRTRVLLPETEEAANNGEVPALVVDKPLVDEIGCGFPYFKLDCVTTRFARLNSTSRALVVSLYRAILERFFIMREAGGCAERPLFCHVLGLDFMTEKKSGSGENGCYMVCFAPAILNMRRSFGGGYFRRAVREVLHALIEGTSNPGAHAGSGTALVTPFAGGALFCQPEGGDTYCAMLGNWLHDMSMRKNSTLAFNCHCVRVNTNKLFMRRVLEAYWQAQRDGLVCDAAEFGLWFCNYGFDCVLKCQDEPLGNYSGRCNCFANALFGEKCGDIEFGERFYLPALALALRILSVWNVQSTAREFNPNLAPIKHVKVHAAKDIRFTLSGACPVDCLFTQEVVCLNEIMFAVQGIRDNFPLTMPITDVYVKIDFCDSTNPQHLIQPKPDCVYHYYTADGGVSPSLCGYAHAELCAIWPCFSNICICHLMGGQGGNYPARWAWEEGDICEAYATGFAAMKCFPVSVPGFNRIFRHRICSFGGWQGAVDLSIQDLAKALNGVVSQRSQGGLNGFPVSAGKVNAYFGEPCYSGCFVCYDWSFIGRKFSGSPDCKVYVCYCGVVEPVAWCAGYDMWHVAQISGTYKAYNFYNTPFVVGPATVRFGGTFFETYRFRNWAAVQKQRQ